MERESSWSSLQGNRWSCPTRASTRCGSRRSRSPTTACQSGRSASSSAATQTVRRLAQTYDFHEGGENAAEIRNLYGWGVSEQEMYEHRRRRQLDWRALRVVLAESRCSSARAAPASWSTPTSPARSSR